MPPKNRSTTGLKRRKFIQLGATSAAAIMFNGPIAAEAQPTGKDPLRTPVCDLFGIRYPIIQAGMGGVAGAALAASISNAGGLGIIAGSFLKPEDLLSRIRQLREMTDKPFGVNLILHQDMITPLDIRQVPAEQVRQVQNFLNEYRRQLNLPEQHDLTTPVPDLLKEEFEVILSENVPVFSIGLGKPTADQVKRCKEKGMKILAMACTVEDSKEISEAGVDAIIAQGGEAGGHRSTWFKKESREHSCIGTMALVPQVVDAVRQPVLAAGGINDGRGLAAALALGAAGVLIGTRFIATKESAASEMHKQALLKASSDQTTVTDKCSGAYARVIRNRFTDHYEKHNGPVLAPWVQLQTARDIFRGALDKNRPEYFTLWAGQGVGSIRNIPGAAEIVDSIVKEATAIITGFSRRP